MAGIKGNRSDGQLQTLAKMAEANTRWKGERLERITQMLKDGLSAGEIAIEFNMTRGAICALVWRTPSLKAIGFARPQGSNRFSRGKPLGPATKVRRPVKLSKIAGVLAAPKPGALQNMHVCAIVAKKESRANDPGLDKLPRVKPAHAAFDAATHHVSLMDLENGDCKWVVDGTGEQARFCAMPAVPGKSWCLHHYRRAFPVAA